MNRQDHSMATRPGQTSPERRFFTRFKYLLIFCFVLLILFLWLRKATPPETEFAAKSLDLTNSHPGFHLKKSAPLPIAQIPDSSNSTEDLEIEISGTVFLEGLLPAAEKPPKKSADPLGCFETVQALRYQVAENRALANVFVYVKSGLEGKTFSSPTQKIELMETNCCFQPYVFGARIDQIVLIKNFKRHHPFKVVFSSGQERAWERLSNGRMSDELEFVFSEGDVLSKITCSVHPWPWAYVGAVSHPFFAVTGKDGKFRLPKGIAQGTYVVAAHHPLAGESTQTINAVPGGKYQLTFKLIPPRKSESVIPPPAGGHNEEMEYSSDSRMNDVPRAGQQTDLAPIATAPNAGRNSGTIRGAVFLIGTPPPEKVIESLVNDPNCGKLYSEPPKTKFFLTDENGHLADVVVFIASGLPKKRFAASTNSISLHQTGCEFSPYIFGIQTRQPFLVRNLDAFSHNFHAVPTIDNNPAINIVVRPGSFSRPIIFQKPEMFVKLKCDMHPWEFSYANVFDHPFFSVSSTNGQFEIANVPPGTYSVAAAHRKTGTVLTEQIRVKAGQVQTIDLKFKLN